MEPVPPSSAGERWNVNMPAVIGVLFVFVVGVIVWVIVSGGDEESAVPSTAPPVVSLDPTTTTPSTVALTTSPTPLPSAPVATTTPTSAPTTTQTTTTVPAGPPTTAPGAVDGAVPGDLGVPGTPMQQPPCDGSFITILASAIGDQATAASIGVVLDQHNGSNYLRTDQSCTSLSPGVDGDPIYVVYFGPFPFASDACAARADGPEDAYARQMSNDIGPNVPVSCSSSDGASPTG